MKRNKTVGQVALERGQAPTETRDPIEIQREAQKDWVQNVIQCIETGKTIFEGSFFVEVSTKKEQVLNNVIRNYFIPKRACPTPTYDQVIYHFHADRDDAEFMWVIPSKDTCETFRANSLTIADDERELLDCVMAFYDGSLLQVAKILNGENEKTPNVVLKIKDKED